MATRDLISVDKTIRMLGKAVSAALLLAGLIGASVIISLSPSMLMAAYGTGGDWRQAADIGQAYGATSAILAGGALAAVLVSLLLQRSQFKHARKIALRRSAHEIVMMAIENPQYAQCWGARFAPHDVDESLFFYTNLIVQQWAHAWADQQLTERQARSFIRQFFDSEVPRMFWERHGDWHHPRRTLTHADRFIELMNQEYLRAIKAGPPSRAYDPLARVERASLEVTDQEIP